MQPTSYVGRFAPSPTGPLHFGSGVTAVASYLQARAHEGRWEVRIDDLDPPREERGAASAILTSLEALHLYWDGEVVYQSARTSAYEAALDELRRRGAVYRCGCTRREVAGGPYPGTCRAGVAVGKVGRALRVRVEHAPVVFRDLLQGEQRTSLASACGDFVVKRADGYFAYHLAAIVDDAWQGVTEIVRGVDLLDSTACQVHLQTLLGLPTPTYAHLPVVLNERGHKLSKQTFARPIEPAAAAWALWHALAFLGFEPAAEVAAEGLDALLAWGVERWQLGRINAASREYDYAAAPNIARSSP